MRTFLKRLVPVPLGKKSLTQLLPVMPVMPMANQIKDAEGDPRDTNAVLFKIIFACVGNLTAITITKIMYGKQC